MNETNPKPLTPKYYRLLEKGEILRHEDGWFNDDNVFQLTGDVGAKLVTTVPYFRPVTVDSWIEYSHQKPTKEDFEPTGMILVLRSDNPRPFPYYIGDLHASYLWDVEGCRALFWKKVTPPQPAKPKSKQVLLRNEDGVENQTVIAHADGHVTTPCGSFFSAESIKEFMRTYEEVVGTKPHPHW